MHLALLNNGATGSYHYVKMGQDHALSLEGERSGKELTLQEFDENGRNTGRFSGRLTDRGVYEGTWVRRGGGTTLPFSLRVTTEW